MPSPRRLRITLDVDVVADADRNIHRTKWEPAALAAIEAAAEVLADRLTDEDVSLSIHPYYEWKYNWSETALPTVTRGR